MFTIPKSWKNSWIAFLPFLVLGVGLDSVQPNCTPTRGTTILDVAVVADNEESNRGLRVKESNPKTALDATAGLSNGPMRGAVSPGGSGFATNAGQIFTWPSFISPALSSVGTSFKGFVRRSKKPALQVSGGEGPPVGEDDP